MTFPGSTSSGSADNAGLLDAYSNAVTGAARVAAPAVVHLEALHDTRRGARHGSGSGFFFTPDGLLLTNSHVVHKAKELLVSTSEGERFSADLVGDDPDSDLAVLRASVGVVPHIRFGNSGALQIGQLAVAIGNPLGFEHTVTAGSSAPSGAASARAPGVSLRMSSRPTPHSIRATLGGLCLTPMAQSSA